MVKSKIFKWAGIALSIAILPIVIGLTVNYITWWKTKDKVEVTFKLDGWITIGSLKFGDLPNLKLMLGNNPVDNILKVSWRIINTGSKGINSFESGPIIKFPDELNVVAVKVSETSPMLKIKEELKFIKGSACIDSLGIFNPDDFFKIDFYLSDISEKNVTSEYFNQWIFQGKALDLNAIQDISYAKQDKSKDRRLLPKVFWYMYIIMYVYFIAFITYFYIRRRKRWYRKAPVSMKTDLKNLKKSLHKVIDQIDQITVE